MKTEEEIIATALMDWNTKHRSDDNWLKSRIQGAWRSGYANAEAQAREVIEAVKAEEYGKGFDAGLRERMDGLKNRDGDIYFNPVFGDLWIVDGKYFVRINDVTYKVLIDDVVGFKRVGHASVGCKKTS